MKIEKIFDPDWLVNVLTKVVNNLGMQEGPKTTQGIQYQGRSSYIGRLRQPLMVCGAAGMLKLKVTCNYSKDKGHMKDNCIHLIKQISCDL